MKRKSTRRSSLFLLELITAIFFFCLASTVCVRFFIKSHTLSQDVKNLDMAVNQTKVFAELLRDGSDLVTIFEDSHPGFLYAESDGSYTFYYDSSWTPSKQAEGAFRIRIRMNKETPLYTSALITVDELPAEKEIYTLECGNYTEGEAR